MPLFFTEKFQLFVVKSQCFFLNHDTIHMNSQFPHFFFPVFLFSMMKCLSNPYFLGGFSHICLGFPTFSWVFPYFPGFSHIFPFSYSFSFVFPRFPTDSHGFCPYQVAGAPALARPAPRRVAAVVASAWVGSYGNSNLVWNIG